MRLKNKLVTAALAAAVLLTSGAAAMAATIKYDTRLYANPGSGAIGWVRAGQWVDVQGCYRNYCFIRKSGPDGFVRASAIGFDRGYDYGWWYSHPRPGFPFYNPGPFPYPGYPHGPSICVGPLCVR